MSVSNPVTRPDASSPAADRAALGSANEVPQQPTVTVIVPIRNEADFITACLNSILRSDYPRERLQVIVVDGMSEDESRQLVQQIAVSDPRLRMLDNPGRIVPQAMNLALREATGEIIVRVDGHTEVPEWFVSRSVAALIAHPECWCAGGSIETVSQTFVGRTIAACMATPVGVGNARFRLGAFEGDVDTVAFGAYWRWVFDRIGGFDEELVCNQDDEFNARLIAAGGRIHQSRDIVSRYYSRASLWQLGRQYFRYGYWRIRTIQKLGRPATVRQMVPFIFVLTLTVLIAVVAWHPMLWPVLASFLLAYAVVLGIGSWQVARRVGFAQSLLAPPVFVILHFAYGTGCCCGLVRFGLLRRRRSRF